MRRLLDRQEKPVSDRSINITLDVVDSFTPAMQRAKEAGERLANEISAHMCDICQAYRRRRGNALLLAVLVEAARRDIRPLALLTRYMGSVHARHTTGGCLSTRPRTAPRPNAEGGTTITVQRSCNGCQTSLGDATDTELDAAVAGAPLPDTRLECGCLDRDGAA